MSPNGSWHDKQDTAVRASELRANHLRPRSSAAYRKLLGIEINMAGCARTAALAQRQQIVEAMVADDLHCRHPRCPRNLADFAVARSYDQCPHDNFPLSISRPFRQTKPAWRQSRWAVNGTADVRNAVWRRRRDSNPRYSFPYDALAKRWFQPLTHVSGNWRFAGL